MKNRIAIYYFNQDDGIVDRYIMTFLHELRSICNSVIFIADSKLLADGRDLLETVCSHVLVVNGGFRKNAYQTALEYISFQNLHDYDTLVFTDNSLAGPFHPIEAMFKEMESLNISYWTSQYESRGDAKIPFGLWAFGREVFESPEFQTYWSKAAPDFKTAREAEEHFITSLSNLLGDAGFVWDSYECRRSRHEGYVHIGGVQDAHYQVSELKMPLLPLRAFTAPLEENLLLHYGGDSRKALDYISCHTNYDIDILLEHLIRVTPQYNFYLRMQHNYLVSSEHWDNVNRYEKPIAVIVHIFYSHLIEVCAKYAAYFPQNTHFFITTTEQKNRETILEAFAANTNGRVTCNIVPNRGRDVSAFLCAYPEIVLNGEYEYICFYHDKDPQHLIMKSERESFAKRCYSVIGTRETVGNIIALFEGNTRLGILSAPPPYVSVYYNNQNVSWNTNRDNVAALAREFALSVPFRSPPVAPYGTVFWFRSKALNALFEYGYQFDDFPEEPIEVDGTLTHAIERIIPLVAQESGYYPAYVQSYDDARSDIVNIRHYDFMLGELWVKHNFFGNSSDVRRALARRLNSPPPQLKPKVIHVPAEPIDMQEYLETIPTVTLIKKVIKRFFPFKKLWKRMSVAYRNKKATQIEDKGV